MKESKFFSKLSRAKVNLTLNVIGKRSDGYHCLDSLVAFPLIGDKISVKPSNSINLEIVGPFAKELGAKENLIMRATSLLDHHGQGASIVLHKVLPISAGLGGGSSNAAVALKMLSDLWKQPLPSITQVASLGADIPVCLNWDLQRMQGKGEKLVRVKEPPEMWIVLVNTGERVSTGLVFDSVKFYRNEEQGVLPVFKTKGVFVDYLLNNRNDLEPPATKLFPQIGILLDAIRNTSDCLISRMSGSGATCFGLFSKKKEAIKASKDLLNLFPKAWVRVAKLFS